MAKEKIQNAGDNGRPNIPPSPPSKGGGKRGRPSKMDLAVRRVEETKQEHSLIVYDAEHDAMVEVTREQQMLAASLHRQVVIGAFITALALKRIRDERLYVALGCHTFDEYTVSMCPFNRAQAYKYLKIAQRFEQLLPNMEELKEIAESKKVNKNSERFVQSTGQMGIEKLYELTRLEDNDLEELTTTGKLSTPDGDYTLEQMQEQTTREFTRQLKEIQARYSGKLSQLDEENKTLQAEKELLEKQMEQNQEHIQDAREIQKLWGRRASKIEEKREMLNEARKTLAYLQQIVFQINIQDDDPGSLQREMLDLAGAIHETHEKLFGLYHEFMDFLGD